MISAKRLIGLGLIGALYLSQQDALLRVSIEPVERSERKPTSLAAQDLTNDPAQFQSDDPNYNVFASPSSYEGGVAGATPANTKEAAEKVRSIRQLLEPKLPSSLAKREAILHYLALKLAQVDLADDSELNLSQAIARLSEDPAAIGADISAILMTATELSLEERLEVISIANFFTDSPQASAPLAQALLEESQRRVGDSDSDATRLTSVAQSYFTLVQDAEPRKQFLSNLKETHGALIAEKISARFSHLTAPPPSTSADSPIEPNTTVETAPSEAPPAEPSLAEQPQTDPRLDLTPDAAPAPEPDVSTVQQELLNPPAPEVSQDTTSPQENMSGQPPQT